MFVDKVVRMDHIKTEMNKKNTKNAAIATLAVIGLAAATLFLQPSGITAMATAEIVPSTGTDSISPGIITGLLGVLLAGVMFLMYKLTKNPDIIKIPEKKAQRIKNPNKVRKQFKSKIYDWLNAHKAYFF